MPPYRDTLYSPWRTYPEVPQGVAPQDMLPAYRYILLLEIAFGIWVLVMLYEECCEMRADGMRAYWSSPWNWLDWVPRVPQSNTMPCNQSSPP